MVASDYISHPYVLIYIMQGRRQMPRWIVHAILLALLLFTLANVIKFMIASNIRLGVL